MIERGDKIDKTGTDEDMGSDEDDELGIDVDVAVGHDPSKPLMTGKDLLESGLIGMWADRDDIGDSAEFARLLGRGKRIRPFD